MGQYKAFGNVEVLLSRIWLFILNSNFQNVQNMYPFFIFGVDWSHQHSSYHSWFWHFSFVYFSFVELFAGSAQINNHSHYLLANTVNLYFRRWCVYWSLSLESYSAMVYTVAHNLCVKCITISLRGSTVESENCFARHTTTTWVLNSTKGDEFTGCFQLKVQAGYAEQLPVRQETNSTRDGEKRSRYPKYHEKWNYVQVGTRSTSKSQ